MQSIRKSLFLSAALLSSFLLFTLALCTIDVQPIGPNGSPVGLASINLAFHNLTGVHLALYVSTDYLSLIPAAICVGFGLLGLSQWIRRKRLFSVDFSLLVLGAFYLLVMAAYGFFEIFIVNYRPVLLDGRLEASYPSSTTMLVLCVISTAILQYQSRIHSKALRRCAIAMLSLFAASMVLLRLLSGVHYLTDILGGALLSAGLVALYDGVSRLKS